MLYSSGLDPLTFDLNWPLDKTTDFCLRNRLERSNQFYSHAEHVRLVNRFHVATVVIGWTELILFLEKKDLTILQKKTSFQGIQIYLSYFDEDTERLRYMIHHLLPKSIRSRLWKEKEKTDSRELIKHTRCHCANEKK